MQEIHLLIRSEYLSARNEKFAEKIHLDRSVSKWIYYTIENSTMCFEPVKRDSQPREARFFIGST